MFLQDWGFSVFLGSTFVTSVISGMTGMAGGLILLGLMISWVQTAFIIPVHGFIQAVSSVSRTFLFFQYMRWKIVFYYSLGIIPGAFLGLQIFNVLPPNAFKLLVGIFILLTTWLPKLRPQNGGKSERYFLILGFLSATLSTFLGAAGAFVAPYFIRNDINKYELVATKSTCQALVHLAKIPIFGFVGVNIFAYWPMLICFTIASFLGIWLGKLLLNYISDRVFFFIFKYLLTIIALRIIVIQALHYL